ncbi:glycosyltransferase family 9 protein [Sedimenticola hydrogenitrophicus]|uniref:glycosyltransferase family 9 protein n=1 Tax=Sedimenticola hydrogenitrophicus TaxID=2967975 RepID=UPI0023B205DE|nr:glycosyltransferase family 9 protein [Sedimenticola hydrogenitrophicus]
MKKVGIIRFSALGDIASTIPIVRGCKYPPVLVTSPLGKALYEDECDSFLVLRNKSFKEVLRLLRELWRGRFDMLVDLQSNDRSKMLTALAMTPRVNSIGINQQQQTTKILSDIAQRTDCFYPLDMTPEKREQSYIVLNAGSSEKWRSKRLPDHKWVEFSRRLLDRFGLPFVLTGSEEEREYVQHIARLVPGKVEVLAGKTTIQELKKLLKEACLTVSTDSGPMHLSAVQKTPTIGLFGATSWIKSAPFGPWSVALYDHVYYAEGRPPSSSRLVVDDYYSNIRIEEGLEALRPVLC